MNDSQLQETFIRVGRTLGFVATQHEPGAIDLERLRNAIDDTSNEFRTPTTAVAYLQAPTGWRQRVILTVLLRVDHPLSKLVRRTADERTRSLEIPEEPRRLRWQDLNAAEVQADLSTLARSGMPLVVEKCITDYLSLDDLSPRMVGPMGVQVVQRQTLRVWNTLAVWMREHTLSPRGTPSLLREADRGAEHLPTLAESAPIFAY